MANETNRRFVKDVNSIIESLANRSTSEAVRAAQRVQARNRGRGVIAGGTGVGQLSEGSIASPLSEVERDFFTTPRTIQTTDGFFTFQVRDIQSLVFQDANANIVVFALAQPPETF